MQDARGFGDEQFARMTAGSGGTARVPSLAAILESGKTAVAPASRAVAASDADFGSAVATGRAPSGAPLARLRLSSGFGMRVHPLLGGYRLHKGVDLAAVAGSPIRATADGVVARADWFGGYGLTVQLEHVGGVETRYGHMSRLNVDAGQRVRKGDTIGYVGSTGRSTGPHLHYEVLVGGRAVDPAGYLAR